MENMDGNINIWKIYHKYIFCQNLDYIYIYMDYDVSWDDDIPNWMEK